MSREGDASSLPFSDEEFDLVVCQQGSQFFPDQAQAVKEIYRVLKPGGRIVLCLPLYARALDTSNTRDTCGYGFILCLSNPPGWEEPETLGLGFISSSIGRSNYCGSSTLRRRNVGGLSPIWRGRSWPGSSSDTDFDPA